LDINGYIKGRNGLCIGNDCRNSWPTSGGLTGCRIHVISGKNLGPGVTNNSTTGYATSDGVEKCTSPISIPGTKGHSRIKVCIQCY
jgi:hypothetical protein